MPYRGPKVSGARVEDEPHAVPVGLRGEQVLRHEAADRRRQPPRLLRGAERLRRRLRFGRIVASDIEVPNIFVHLV